MSVLISPLAAQAQEPSADGPAPAEEPQRITDETLREYEATSMSELEGITVDDAFDAIKRQPRVEELQAALSERGPAEFGGLYIEYRPNYSLHVLAEPNGGPSVREAITSLGFDDLKPFVLVRETLLTEKALHTAQEALGRIRGVPFTWSDIDLMSGRVLVAVAGRSDVEGAREAIRRADLGRVPADRVHVAASTIEEQDAYGGLGMDSTGEGCTSGFTVLHIASGDEGIANAAHCPNFEVVAHHSGVMLDLVNEKQQDSADAQWYRTPGLDDLKKFRTDFSGTTRWVYGRVNRTAMAINGVVCKFGKITGYGCGTIGGKSFDPDTLTGTNKYNATWIRMNSDMTSQGDSGGPWFQSNDAYGIHTGKTTCGRESENTECYSYWMAQDYLESSLGVQVRIATP